MLSTLAQRQTFRVGQNILRYVLAMHTPGRIVVLLAALALAGCSGGNDRGDPSRTAEATTASTVQVEPADGTTLKTDDFSYTVPKGWVESDAAPAAESLARDATDRDGFADNVNVIRLDPAPIDDLGDLEDASVSELKDTGATGVKVLDRQVVDGSDGIHVTAGLMVDGLDYVIEQFNVVHDDVAYVVTFSFSAGLSARARNEVSQSVMMTWNWSD